MVTPLKQTFAYKNLIIKVEDLTKTEELIATQSSIQRSNRAMAQEKENSILGTKVQEATNLTLEAKKICVSKPTYDCPDSIPSNTRSSNDMIISQLTAKVTKLTSKMEYLH